MIRTGKLRSRIFLFAQPSFLTGIARVADPLGSLDRYNVSPSPEIADYRAIQSDWMSVGDDLTLALQQFAEESERRSR